MATKNNSGLPDPMPKAPGHRLAGTPPSRAEADGEKPHWLRPESAAWPKARVNQIDQRLKSRAGFFSVQAPTLRTIDGFQILP